MTDINVTVLYVAEPAAAASFYADILGRAPQEKSPNFVAFEMGNRAVLGLWRRDQVTSAVAPQHQSGEIVMMVGDNATVDATHEAWRKRGIAIAQKPTAMEFAYNFVGLDPDGHRIRVACPAASAPPSPTSISS